MGGGVLDHEGPLDLHALAGPIPLSTRSIKYARVAEATLAYLWSG